MVRLLVIVLVLALVPLSSVFSENSKDLAKKPRALMVIAEKNFRDEELFVPRKMFEEKGMTVSVASTTTNTATGMLKGKVKPDILIKDVNVEDYDVVVFVGGSGAQMYYNNAVAQQIARNTVKQGKLLAAICLAPNILANAGLLEGKKATCFDSANLKKRGAKYQDRDVVKDGKIITANGPKAAHEFGEMIINTLAE